MPYPTFVYFLKEMYFPLVVGIEPNVDKLSLTRIGEIAPI